MRQFLLFLLFTPGIVFSQFENDFEVLDHRNRIAYGIILQVMENKIYCQKNVSRDLEFGETHIISCDSKGEIEEIFSSYLQAHVRSWLLPDSSIQIILYNLVDYDISWPGCIILEISDSTVFIDTLFAFEDYYSYSDLTFVHSVQRDSLSKYYFSTFYNGILYGDLDGPFDTINIAENFSNIYTNKEGDIFFSSNKKFGYFDGDSLIPIAQFNNWISQYHNLGSYNLFFVRDTIYSYSNDFEPLDTFPRGDIKNFDTLDNQVYLIKDRGSQLDLCRFYGNENVTIVATFNKAEEESIYNFRMVDSLSFLVSGSLSLAPFHSNPFFRKYHISQPGEYQRVDISIDSFRISFEGIRSEFLRIDNMGDSVFIKKFDYVFEGGMTNHSDEDLVILNSYTEPFLVGPFGQLPYFELSIFDTLKKGESFIFSKKKDFTHPINTKVLYMIPGANFKFNSSEQNTVLSDFPSSTSEPVVTALQLNVYPNPAYDKIKIEHENNLESVAIYNLEGQLMYLSKNIGNYEIDVSRFPAGIYLVKARMKRSEQVFQGKFIKI